MIRIRVEYKKENLFIFLSNLDIIKYLERTLRRSELPIVYTQGFNPKPKMDFSPALPLGIPSESEIFEFYLTQKTANDQILEKLKKSVDKELTIKRVREINITSPLLSYLITHFEIELIGEIFRKFDFKNFKIKKENYSYLELKNFLFLEEEISYGKRLIISKNLSLRLFYENLKIYSNEMLFIKKIKNLRIENGKIYDSFDLD
ncbi:MAG: TIGR03936 family radical SAM-associated protein [Caldisericia bacterium]|jgi:radical SAM-linked protein|nr:TIGR03936 family radical SAM-associated protein [Caldisericia bacterium]